MSTARLHLKNIVSLLFSGAASKILVFLATIQIIKGLSVANNGVYQIAYSLGFIYSIFAELGVRGYLLREIAKVRHDFAQCQKIFSDTFYLRVVIAAIVLPISVAINFLLGYNSTVVYFAFCLTVYAILDTFAVLLKYLLRAYDRMEFDPLFTTIGRGVLLLAVVVLANSGSLTIERIAAIHIVAALLELALLVVVVKVVLPIEFFARISWTGAVNVLRASIPFAVVNLAGFLYLKTGLILLSLVRGEEAAAYFGTAGRVPEAAAFLPIALANAFIPFFTRNASDIAIVRRYFSALVQVAAFSGAILAALFIFETDFIIRLVSKEEYLVASTTFRLYGAWIFFSFIQVIVTNLLICLGEEKALMRRYVIALVANLLLNVLLIPLLGISGAALALVLSECGAMIYNYLILHRHQVTIPVSVFLESLLLATIVAFTTVFTTVEPLLRAILSGATCSVVAAALLHFHYPDVLKTVRASPR